MLHPTLGYIWLSPVRRKAFTNGVEPHDGAEALWCCPPTPPPPHAVPLAMEIHQTSALWLLVSFLNAFSALWAQLLTPGHLNLIYKWKAEKKHEG